MGGIPKQVCSSPSPLAKVTSKRPPGRTSSTALSTVPFGSDPIQRRTQLASALVNDAHREFWGADAIRRWVAKEMVGDKVTIEVTEAIEHYGETIVRGRYDGEFDKRNLPDELILTNYFTVRDGRIVSLMVIRNTPAH